MFCLNIIIKTFYFNITVGAAVAEWLSSWLAEQEDRGSIPRLATWIFRDWLSPASKSRYGWKIAKSTLILKTTNQPTNITVWGDTRVHVFIKHLLVTLLWSQWMKVILYKRVHVHVTTVLPCFGNNNGGIMSFTKRLFEGYKKLKTSVKRDNYPNNEVGYINGVTQFAS